MHIYLLHILKCFTIWNYLFYNRPFGTGKEKSNQKKYNITAHQTATPENQMNISDAPYADKYAVQSVSRRGRKAGVSNQSPVFSNRGSAALEAVCIIPLLFFAFWAFYSMGQVYIVENQIYQATMDTAEELAEYAYMTEYADLELLGTATAAQRIREYLPEGSRIDNYVEGGRNGLRITEAIRLDEEGFLCIQLQYRIHIPAPFLPDLTAPLQVQVRQKAYTGYREDGTGAEQERYVYLAEYSSVYHCSRNCSHLDLTILQVPETLLQTEYTNLKPCAYCGMQDAGVYYITATGDCYHTSMQCSGLKRTVRRVPISEAQGYAPCSRCGE